MSFFPTSTNFLSSLGGRSSTFWNLTFTLLILSSWILFFELSLRIEVNFKSSSCLDKSLIKLLLWSFSKFGFPPNLIICFDKLLIISSSFWTDKSDNFSLFFKNSFNWFSLRASTLLTPAAIEDWLIILNRPISPVFLTCVPPQSSVEKYFSFSSPIDKTLTSSPYFSPKRASAPLSTASLGVIILVFTSDFFSTIEFT